MSLTIRDVGPRDGLQTEAYVLSPGVRAELVTRLSGTGLPRIEAASFASPKRVPQMAAAEEVVARIQRGPGVAYAGLALNEKGYERLLLHHRDERTEVDARVDALSVNGRGSPPQHAQHRVCLGGKGAR